MMKKFGLLAISLAVSVSLAACGKTTNNQNQEEITTPVKTEQINDSSFYFTANHNGISKVDTASNKIVETIAIEGAVHNVQISPDGKTIAATLVSSSGSHGEQGEETHSEHGSHDEQTNGLALFYDAKTNKLIKQVEVGSHPAHIVFTKNNKYALVTNNEDNNVSIIDLASYKVIHNISTGKGPHGFRISQDSNNAYIANMGEDTVSYV